MSGQMCLPDSAYGCRKCGEDHPARAACQPAAAEEWLVTGNDDSVPVCLRCGGPWHGAGPCPMPPIAFACGGCGSIACKGECARFADTFTCPSCGGFPEACSCLMEIVVGKDGRFQASVVPCIPLSQGGPQDFGDCPSCGQVLNPCKVVSPGWELCDPLEGLSRGVLCSHCGQWREKGGDEDLFDLSDDEDGITLPSDDGED